MTGTRGDDDSTTPQFSSRFRRLCQAAAVATGKVHVEVVAGLIAASMVFNDGPWREPEDWRQAVEELLGLTVPESDVLAARDLAQGRGDLIFDARTRSYRLSEATRNATIERIEAGDTLERAARSSWLSDTESVASDLPSDALWQCLLSYTGAALLRHGADAVSLVGGAAFHGDSADSSPEQLLKAAIKGANLDLADYERISEAIGLFFNGANPERVRYIAELSDSTFALLSLQLDSDTRDALLHNLPELTIFIDSNVILGILAAHTAPLAAASSDLLRLVKESNLPFKLYYHEKTLSELERTINGLGDRLRRRTWTQFMSRTLLNVPNQITSIEVRFHEINAVTPTSPDVYLSRYSNLPRLLNDYGLTIFREPVQSQDSIMLRGQLVAHYQAFINEKRPGGTSKTYQVLDHDISIWLSARDRLAPRGRGALFSGALVLSADSLLRRFDREVLAREYGGGTWLVTFPDVLLRALRPLLQASPDYDATFTRVFSTPEFRGIAGDMTETVIKVAAYLATFADLPEETASNLITNSLLMARLRTIDETSEEFARAIEEQLVLENVALLKEQKELREEVAAIDAQTIASAAMLRKEAARLAADGASDHVVEALERAAEHLSSAPTTSITIHGGIQVTTSDNSKDVYYNQNSQVGAQGRSASADHVTQLQDQRELTVALPDLAVDLLALKEELLARATTADEYRAVAEVQAAADAAAANEASSVVRSLRNAGKWVLEVAKSVGTAVAAAAINEALGIEAN